MEGAKRYAVAGGLVVVILICAIFAIKRVSPGIPDPPERVLAIRLNLMDKDTMEVVTLTVGEMRKLQQKDGYFRNAKTGNYTLTIAMRCVSCGQEIPAPVPPPSLREDYFKGVPTVVDQMERRKWEAEQTCPKCGGNPFL